MTKKCLLVQLPVPFLNWRRKTGNVPLAGACLKQSVSDITNVEVKIMPQSTVSYLGEGALIGQIMEYRPDVVGFTLYCWNLDRTLYLARKIKEALPAQVWAGGPEVTEDNERLRTSTADKLFVGEGEGPFRRMFEDGLDTGEGRIFARSPSPYLSGLLEPKLDDVVLLETQRGCPHRCAYCYYRKSHNTCIVPDNKNILRCVEWCIENGISELYLLDPCLDAREGLEELLISLAALNSRRSVSITSEIRAESVDDATADLFAAANFTMFEIGLQSINPEALRKARRKTDLGRFIEGIERLRKRGISFKIDLIVGLPGDNPEGFKRTVDFVVEHDLHNNIQVFPLYLLPGTEFRLRHSELGIDFFRNPPYLVKSVPAFSEQDIYASLSYAEDAMGVSLFPSPDLDIAYRREELPADGVREDYGDFFEGPYVYKILVTQGRAVKTIKETALKMASPYQVVFVEGSLDEERVHEVLGYLSHENPYTPFEVVFHEPRTSPNIENLIRRIPVPRPSYLDMELRYMYERHGNRSVVFTVVSRKRERFFGGPMCRQVYWWSEGRIPTAKDLNDLWELDGVLIDPKGVLKEEIIGWQNAHYGMHSELPAISFAEEGIQKRWLYMTCKEELCRGALFRAWF